MEFYPDIVVRGQGWPRNLLAVGVEDDVENPLENEKRIKSYMAHKRCPAGLLISPVRFRVYRNNYLPETPDSVVQVADFRTAHIMGPVPVLIRGPEFEDFVQRWLERLQTDYPRNVVVPADARQVVDSEIMPALYDGEIRATGFRWPQAAS